MSRHVFAVLTNPVEGREPEFNAWYDRHLHDILRLPGLVSAQRFQLSRNGVGEARLRFITAGAAPGPGGAGQRRLAARNQI